MSQPLRGEQTWIDAAADRFEREWNSRVPIGPVSRTSWPADENGRARLIEELVRVECELRRAAGEQPSPGEYLVRFADDWQAVNAAFLDEERPRRRSVR